MRGGQPPLATYTKSNWFLLLNTMTQLIKIVFGLIRLRIQSKMMPTKSFHWIRFLQTKPPEQLNPISNQCDQFPIFPSFFPQLASSAPGLFSLFTAKNLNSSTKHLTPKMWLIKLWFDCHFEFFDIRILRVRAWKK